MLDTRDEKPLWQTEACGAGRLAASDQQGSCLEEVDIRLPVLASSNFFVPPAGADHT